MLSLKMLLLQRWSLGSLFLVAGILATFAPVSESLRPCLSNKECGEGRCCLSPIMRKGRRKRQEAGYCKPLGEAGDLCYVQEFITKPAVYYDACPCASGLDCQGTGLYEVPQGERGQCGASVKKCKVSADCGSDECCVSLIRPIGRKKREELLPGVCKKLGKAGDSCLVNNSPLEKGKIYFESCPCSRGLNCKGKNLFDIPLGEIGTCTSLFSIAERTM